MCVCVLPVCGVRVCSVFVGALVYFCACVRLSVCVRVRVSGSFYLDIWRVDTRVEPFGDSTLLDDLHHCIQWVLERFGRTAATVWKFGAHVSAHEASGVSSGGVSRKRRLQHSVLGV